uniref:C2 domain-containing protein n=1 Tax=Hemiselmis andersenii TaxID=464988 RepID=A0A7S1H842_HEMAN
MPLQALKVLHDPTATNQPKAGVGPASAVERLGEILSDSTSKDAATDAENAITAFQSMAPIRHTGKEDELVTVAMTVWRADDLPRTRWMGKSDPYCTIEEQGGQKHKTHIITGTQAPRWGTRFSMEGTVYDTLTVRVTDKHASVETADLGSVSFRPIDMLKRVHAETVAREHGAGPGLTSRRRMSVLGGFEEDTDWMQFVDLQFSLQTLNGLPSTGNVHLSLHVNGYVDLSAESKDKHVELITMADNLQNADSVLGILSGEDTAAVAKVDMLAILGGEKPLLQGVNDGYYAARSFLVLGPRNVIRKKAYKIVNSWLFAFLSWAMAVAALVSFVVNQRQPAIDPTDTLAMVEFVAFCFLGLEMLMKSCSFGFSQGARSFLFASFFNITDLLVFLSYWTEMAFSGTTMMQQFTLRPLRSFRILVPLMQFTVFGGLTAIFTSLKLSFVSMTTIVLFLVIFAMGFAVFGITFYSNSFARRCVSVATGALIEPSRWCKISKDGTSQTCPEPLMTCKVVGNMGPNHFDSLDGAMLTVFQALSLDEQWDSLNRAMQSEPEWSGLGLFFFVFLTFFCRFMLFNICVAIITQLFTKVRNEVSSALEYMAETAWSKTAYSRQRRMKKALREAAKAVVEDADDDALEQAYTSALRFTAAENSQMGSPTSPSSPTAGRQVLRPGSPRPKGSPRTRVSPRSKPISPKARAAADYEAIKFALRSSAAMETEGSSKDCSRNHIDIHGSSFIHTHSFDKEEAPDATKISLHEVFYMTVNHPCFEIASMVLVIINTVMLALDSAFVSEDWHEVQSAGLIVIHTIFVLELGLRMVGADSLSTFFESGSRRFDFVVILVTALALFGNFVLGISREQLAPIAAMSALRFMRVMAKIPTIQHLLHMTLASITNIINLLIFTLVFLAVFAMCAVYIFCPENNEACLEAGDFHTFWASMRTLYFIFTGETVNSLMYRTMDLGNTDPEYYSKEYTWNMTPLFVVGFFFFSQGVVINLYIAVIIENFNVDNAAKTAEEQGGEKADEKRADFLQKTSQTALSILPNPLREAFCRLAARVLGINEEAPSEAEQKLHDASEKPPEDLMKMDGGQIRELEQAAAAKRQGSVQEPSNVLRTPTHMGLLARQLTSAGNKNLVSPSSRVSHDSVVRQESMGSKAMSLSRAGSDMSNLVVRQGSFMPSLFDDASEGDEEEGVEDKAFFIFSYDSFVRQLCIDTVQASWFTVLILSTILLSCVALAMEPPTREHEPTGLDFASLDILNLVTTALFTFEFVVQAVSKGLVMHNGAYLRNTWNLVDFLVLVLSYIDLSGLGETKQARVLRLGRALRPLRLIKRNQGMRLIVDALLATWRSVSMIILLALSLAIVFACIGMACFKGTFYYCSDPDGAVFPAGKTECSGNFMGKTHMRFDALGSEDEAVLWLAPRAWLNPALNFDDFTSALVTLAAVNCFNYAHVMSYASDGTSPGQSSSRDNNAVVSGVFFVCYTITASLFIMNLFVAFLIDGFNQLRQAEQGERECRAVYVQYFRTVSRVSPHTAMPIPKSKFRTFLRERVYGSPVFSSFFTLCVFVNVSIMALYSEELYPDLAGPYDAQNHIFFALMLLEAVLSVMALGLGTYLEDRWVWVDIAAIAGSTLGYFVPESTFVRAFRLTRVFRVISNVPALRRMLETLTASFVQIGNVVLLMLVVFSMFAILCVNFLGTVREGIPVILGGRLGSPEYQWPANPPNFSSFSKSMVVLFQIVQGDDWHFMMYDSMVQEPFCTEQFEGKSYGDCGTNPFAAVVIFVGFKLVAEFVLLNLFIGMILDAFMKTSESRIEFYLVVPPVQALRGVKKGSKKQNSRALVSHMSSARMTSSIMPSADGTFDSSGAGNASQPNSESVRSTSRGKRMSYERSCVEVWKNIVGEGRNDFLLISDVTVLLRSLPQPLGFPRNAFGEPELSSHDRAALKLIRAELNLIAVSRPEDERGFWARQWSRVFHWVFGVEQPLVPDTMHATFDEVFETLFHWRCTAYTPNEVREERAINIAEVVRTAHAILVAKLIRRWIYLSRAKKAPGYQPGARSLINWMAENQAGQATDAAVINAALDSSPMANSAERKAAFSKERRRSSVTTPATPSYNVFHAMQNRLLSGESGDKSGKSNSLSDRPLGQSSGVSRSGSDTSDNPQVSPMVQSRSHQGSPVAQSRSPGGQGLAPTPTHKKPSVKTKKAFGSESWEDNALSRSSSFDKNSATALAGVFGDHSGSLKKASFTSKGGAAVLHKAAVARTYQIPGHESVRNHVRGRGVYKSTFEPPPPPPPADGKREKRTWKSVRAVWSVGAALKSDAGSGGKVRPPLEPSPPPGEGREVKPDASLAKLRTSVPDPIPE